MLEELNTSERNNEMKQI